ncbi:uncharacterized protein [Medicago truncatula]|uniref:uncharacterized protein isoform X2 n=2 Tax=Medicago truncatula TaxID=3880 RepID=UPI001967BFD1|nr:uncharacterized protein LOC11405938 isoform X2 [Medicago truncatula]
MENLQRNSFMFQTTQRKTLKSCQCHSDDDEGCDKPPGLVARLMGLDSLSQCSSTSLCCHLDSLNMALKSNKSSCDTIEPKAHKVGNTTMKRFQNETLFSKSAKPISVTHNKHLSPIKSHVNMKPKNTAYIMGASAKRIVASPELYMRSTMSSIGHLSVPLRTLDLQEKLEIAQLGSKMRSNLYKSTSIFKGSRDSENNRSCLGKGKFASLATPSKTLVQSRDTLNLNGNRRYLKKKEIKSNHKNWNGQNSTVLRQTSKGKSSSKVDTNKSTQTCSSESSTGARTTTNKCAVNSYYESKKSRTRVTDKQKELSVSKRKSSSEKKRCDQNDARGSDNVVNTHDRKSIKCNVTMDESIYNDAYSMTESRDVISFTFKSPLRKNASQSQSTTKQVMETRTRIDVDSFLHVDKVYPTRLHVMDVDTLSVMLSHINPPQCTLEIERCSDDFESISEDRFNNMACNTSREHDNFFHLNLLSDKLDSMDDNCCSSNYYTIPGMNQQLQISEPMEDLSRNSNESRDDLCYQHTRTVATFENPFISKSNLDSEDSTYGGNRVYSSMQDEKVYSSQINESISPEYKMNWSEKSSTRSSRMMELEYVKDILRNVELIAEELVVGETDNIMMLTLFDLLENQRTGVESYEEYSKLKRKAIFDCVSECIELRCRQVFVTRCKAWPRCMVASVKRKGWLAEVYKEMVEFRSMEEEVMVDELVSKDMSTPLGRWLDFDIEAFENGLELELDIVTYLIDELVSDLWLV